MIKQLQNTRTGKITFQTNSKYEKNTTVCIEKTIEYASSRVVDSPEQDLQ